MTIIHMINQILDKYPAMTRWILMGIWLLLFTLMATAAQAQCRGNHQKLMAKNDTLIIPCDDMVLMNMPTFEIYYLAEKNLEALKKQLPEYKAIRDSLEAELQANSKDYQAIINDQEKMIQLESMSKQDALQTAIHLDAELAKEKRKGKFWKTTSLALGGTVIIFIFGSLIN